MDLKTKAVLFSAANVKGRCLYPSAQQIMIFPLFADAVFCIAKDAEKSTEQHHSRLLQFKKEMNTSAVLAAKSCLRLIPTALLTLHSNLNVPAGECAKTEIPLNSEEGLLKYKKRLENPNAFFIYRPTPQTKVLF